MTVNSFGGGGRGRGQGGVEGQGHGLICFISVSLSNKSLFAWVFLVRMQSQPQKLGNDSFFNVLF